MPERFRGGPLEDGRASQIHSLVVHIQGDDRQSVGAYIQEYADGVPLGYFTWNSSELPPCTCGEGNGPCPTHDEDL